MAVILKDNLSDSSENNDNRVGGNGFQTFLNNDQLTRIG